MGQEFLSIKVIEEIMKEKINIFENIFLKICQQIIYSEKVNDKLKKIFK